MKSFHALRLLLVCVVLLVGMCGGCAPLTFLYHAFVPETIPAQYVPPRTPMLIIVEHGKDPSTAVAECDLLARYIADELLAYKVCPVVDRKLVQQLRDSGENADKLTISEMGKRTKATQVLYVDLQYMDLGAVPTGAPAQARMEIRLHVVDVASAKTVFPARGSDVLPLSFETPMGSGQTRADVNALREALLHTAGSSIGRLFHECEPEE